ncbi:AN1-type zinc finger protein 2A-like isoform X6 [Ambystoma mexicanum]|uniref:AN1-type zinc finger protein 2A-like isoform X6 n=1 Tax=Ambystoma mexicanum TaxID=8296 RepID=UPI0037E96C86
MEFPDLGKHCSEHTCKQLDFLPMKCDACEQIFCKDHIAYIQHSCTSAYKKDVQVPVCPLCNIPIPVKRGQMPDIVVGAHIDQDCKSDPAQRKRKIYTNRCLKPGCKQKEMMKVICDQCHGNFCLKHRHPLDHECKGGMAPISKAGCYRLVAYRSFSWWLHGRFGYHVRRVIPGCVVGAICAKFPSDGGQYRGFSHTVLQPKVYNV